MGLSKGRLTYKQRVVSCNCGILCSAVIWFNCNCPVSFVHRFQVFCFKSINNDNNHIHNINSCTFRHCFPFSLLRKALSLCQETPLKQWNTWMLNQVKHQNNPPRKKGKSFHLKTHNQHQTRYMTCSLCKTEQILQSKVWPVVTLLLLGRE